MTQKIMQFVSDARQILEKHNIKCNLVQKEKVEYSDGTLSCGYFDENAKELAVAIDKPIEEWFETFVHEYCHFEQWNENVLIWKNCMIDDDYVLDVAIRYFNGNAILSAEQLNDYLDRAAKLEKDCEIRVLSKIKEYKLPINQTIYAQKANAYITFYYVMNELKSWYDTPPYLVKEIVEIMPDRVEGIDHKALAEQFLHLYKKHCIKEK
jgi:hypothetical protein